MLDDLLLGADLGFDGGLTAALGVSDLDRALAWYGDILGFRLRYRKDEIGWCELATPVAKVNIGLSVVEKAGGPGGATLTFGVRYLDAARARLEERGVRFDGPSQDIPGLARLATFYDPDDNALMLYQDLSGAHNG